MILLKNKPKEFKVFFLLEFTKELIRNSGPSDILKLEKIGPLLSQKDI